MLISLGIDSRVISGGVAGLGTLHDRAPGCVLVDMDSCGVDVASLFTALPIRRADLPIVAMCERADATLIIELMRLGVCDILVKPLDRDTVAASLGFVFNRLAGETQAYWRRQGFRAKIAELSDRERDIMRGLLAGSSNKALAHDLGISIRTVEMHRSNLMSKLGVDSLAQAIRMTFDAGIIPGDRDDSPVTGQGTAPTQVRDADTGASTSMPICSRSRLSAARRA